MTSTNRFLCVVLLLGFAACDSDKVSGTGGAGGGPGSGGAGGKAVGGNGGSGGSGGAGGAGGGVGGHPHASGGAGGGGQAGGGGTAGGAGGSGGTAGGHGGSAGGTAGGAGGGAGSAGGTAGGGAGGKGGGAGGKGGQPACTFSATYTVNDEGGIAAFVKRTILSPPAMFEYDHQSGPSGPTQSCTPALPACGSPTKIDVSDVEAAMASTDVQAAFAAVTEPFYGDRNVADGPSFEVVRSTGGKFLVGLECTTASATCTPTPPGVHTLVHLLQDLITQQTADPSCAAQ